MYQTRIGLVLFTEYHAMHALCCMWDKLAGDCNRGFKSTDVSSKNMHACQLLLNMLGLNITQSTGVMSQSWMATHLYIRDWY